MTKTCGRCRKELPRTAEFFHRKGNGFAHICKECRKIVHREHYEKNKEDYIRNKNERRDALKEEVNKLKSDPCHYCNNSYPAACMDFHHEDDNKEGSVADMVKRGSGTDSVMREILKCKLTCCLCHRIITSYGKDFLEEYLKRV